MVLALCHHSLGPKVMCRLLWSRGLTKGPAAEESPQPAQASELHVGVWGQCLLRPPDRTSPQGPSTSPRPRDTLSPRADFRADLPLGREVETSPCSAELKARQESLHTLKCKKRSLHQEPISALWSALVDAQPSPGAQGQPLPCSVLPREQRGADPSETCGTTASGLGRGKPPPGYNDCLFC